MMTIIAGRSCPPHYGYPPRVFVRPPEIAADTLYAIGGLYGNPLALGVIERMAAADSGDVRLVFNGDFHWFDAEPALYTEIQQRVLAGGQNFALRGNVETEIASENAAAGCGCAYPESVPDADVERSNAILERLRSVASGLPRTGLHSRQTIGSLPMHAVAQVGELRIAVVHGDAWSLAGWRFAHDALHHQDAGPRLERALEAGAIDGFACSHTCAPALRSVRNGFIINNGAAGMANFAASTFGVVSRISTRALPARLEGAWLFGLHERGVRIDALRVEFDVEDWLTRFDAIWPAGTPAAVSYRDRLVRGPAYTLDHALGHRAMDLPT